MKYQIIGDQGTTRETKNGKHIRSICVIDPNPPQGWKGLKAEVINLFDAQLEVLSIDTVNGKFYDPQDEKNYYIDIDYNRNGWIVSARVYNG